MTIPNFFRSAFRGRSSNLNKDPKRVLESLRIEEEDPLLNHRPRKFRQRKNELNQVSSTAILSLCLVTGMSTGMGSAFANTIDDNSTGHIPLDEPPSKVQLDTNVELPQMQSSQTNSSELTPSKPPLDEPAATNNPKQPTKEPAKSKEENHQEKNKTTTNQAHTPPKTTEKEPVKHHSKPKHQKQEPAKSHQAPSKHTMQDKKTKTETHKNSPENEATYVPKTEDGGALPHTAGNDLNNAIAGVGVALAGSLLLKRKRAKAK